MDVKAVLMSIQPKWCELIASGKKTIEIRKTKPKLDVPFKVYIYMTAGDAVYPVTINGDPYTCSNVGGRSVIGEFVCDDITKILNHGSRFAGDGKTDGETNTIADGSCLMFDDMKKYLGTRDGYAWNISDLVIYDKQKSLNEFKPWNRTEEMCKYSHLGLAIPKCDDCHECQVTRQPQSWIYVEELK